MLNLIIAIAILLVLLLLLCKNNIEYFENSTPPPCNCGSYRNSKGGNFNQPLDGNRFLVNRVKSGTYCTVLLLMQCRICRTC